MALFFRLVEELDAKTRNFCLDYCNFVGRGLTVEYCKTYISNIRLQLESTYVPFLLLWRINIIKLYVLIKLIYRVMAILITFPIAFYWNCQSEYQKCIWDCNVRLWTKNILTTFKKRNNMVGLNILCII